jgi:hypothetical protein
LITAGAALAVFSGLSHPGNISPAAAAVPSIATCLMNALRLLGSCMLNIPLNGSAMNATRRINEIYKAENSRQPLPPK